MREGSDGDRRDLKLYAVALTGNVSVGLVAVFGFGGVTSSNGAFLMWWTVLAALTCAVALFVPQGTLAQTFVFWGWVVGLTSFLLATTQISGSWWYLLAMFSLLGLFGGFGWSIARQSRPVTSSTKNSGLGLYLVWVQALVVIQVLDDVVAIQNPLIDFLTSVAYWSWLVVLGFGLVFVVALLLVRPTKSPTRAGVFLVILWIPLAIGSLLVILNGEILATAAVVAVAVAAGLAQLDVLRAAGAIEISQSTGRTESSNQHNA